ncbi:FAD-dependent monooxygenase [Paenibacillus mucilaginosus]|uniref:FAD-dependent monooxygenase n=1 Tax=Paenibacillus mucilaginosus TaxID=61624 RepID=UPI0030C67065
MKPEGTSAGARIREAGGRALIIGGGIGGLSAAIALQAAGWDAAVYERGPSLAGAGAGIVLAANAMKLLDRFGAGAEVRAREPPSGRRRSAPGRAG